MSDAKIIARSLLKQAEQIAEAGHAGWGNLDRDAADLIEQQATQIAELQASAITAEPIYQTRWGRPETVWGDVPKAAYDDYQSFGYVARRIVYTAPQPFASAIEATAALIANGLVGQASEEDVREVERLILELLGVKS
jgi:hypothetical protein